MRFFTISCTKNVNQAFFASQFSYCPLVWMFHHRQINIRINGLHYRALRMVYQDENSSFEELLRKDGSVTIHHRNLQFLATEMYKVTKGIGPALMQDIFMRHPNDNLDDISANTRQNSGFYNPANPKNVNSGLETLRCLGPKIWDMVPVTLRNIESLNVFKAKIKGWISQRCPCRLCKTYVSQLGYL